jgi:hypothetical protein
MPWRSVVFVGLFGLFGFACAEASAPAPVVLQAGEPLATPAVTAYRGPPRGQGAMPGVHATRMASALSAAGLDVANLPPLETLRPGPKQRVMRTFTEALGIPCVGCHAEDDFAADTRRKRATRRMWNEIVRVLALRDGSPLYCDSCHDGAIFHLDRRDAGRLGRYMCDVMADGLRRVDGRAHDCTSCHGDPPDMHLLETWKTTPSPRIVHTAPASSADTVLTPVWPLEGARAPAECGPGAVHCPLDAWMRLVIAPNVRHREQWDALPSALDRVAAFAPRDERFGAFARAAAAAARKGNPATLRAACGACHAAYKSEWRATHRADIPVDP